MKPFCIAWTKGWSNQRKFTKGTKAISWNPDNISTCNLMLIGKLTTINLNISWLQWKFKVHDFIHLAAHTKCPFHYRIQRSKKKSTNHGCGHHPEEKKKNLKSANTMLLLFLFLLSSGYTERLPPFMEIRTRFYS